MRAELQSYHIFDRIIGACYPPSSALSQRRTAVPPEASLHTLGSFVLALQAPDGAALPTSGSQVLIDIVTKATVINQAVLAILAVISVMSWAIILSKVLLYRRVEAHSAKFLETFRKSTKFSEVQAACPTLPASPLVGVFQSGYAELNAQFRRPASSPEPPAATAPRPMLRSLAAVDRALLRAATVEINKLEKRVSFLATVASVAPFIGLFGTVVGITIAFQRIGTTGSTNLAVVGPSISEALIATAAGLFAAIPSVLAYNHFSTRIKTFAAEMDDFALEFLNIAERNFT